MRIHKILAGSLLLVGLAACNNENKGNDDGKKGIENPAYAQFALTLSNGSTGGNMAKADPTRDSIDHAGTTEEQTIVDITFAFVNEKSNQIAASATIGRNDLTPGASGSNGELTYLTEPIEVPRGTYTIYACINAPASVKAELAQGKTGCMDIVFQNADGNIDNKEIAAGGNFMMSNYRTDTLKKTLTEENTINNPLKAQISVERTAAKVQYNTVRAKRSGYDFPVYNNAGTEIGDVPTALSAMKLSNLNTKTYVFGHNNRENTTIEDPNHTNTPAGELVANNSSSAGFEDLGVEGTPLYPDIYCMENTFTGGQDAATTNYTGVFFRAKHTPGADVLANGKVLVGGQEVEVTNTLESDGTFYQYAGVLLANKESLEKYYTAAVSVDDQVDPADAITLLDKLADLTDEELYQLDTTYGIKVYKQGYSYYHAVIGHEYEDPTNGSMTPMEYAVVRNHWYMVAVTKISNFGEVIPTIPDEPVESENAFIQMEVRVMPWHLVVNDFEL